MAGFQTYKDKIRKAVKADHGGEVPQNLELTIDNYAKALVLRDTYLESVTKEPMVWSQGLTNGIPTKKQNPLCNLLYQQEGLCQTYAKMLGLTAAKAAVKTEGQGDRQSTENIEDYLKTIQG